MLGHVADGYNYFCGRAGRQKVEWSDAVAKGKADKATIVAALKASTTTCATAHTGKDAGSPLLLQNFGHTNLHYGNIVTYMRMLGLVPPSSQAWDSGDKSAGSKARPTYRASADARLAGWQTSGV